MSFPNALAVFVGAGLGGLARWVALSLLPGAAPFGFSLALFFVNVTGGFLAGAAFAVLSAVELKYTAAGLFVMTGFLGGFTTFSAFTAEGYGLWVDRPWVSTIQASAHVISCLLAFGLAIKLFRSAPI